MEITDKVYAAMQKANKPMKTGEVAEITGIEKKDAEKAIKTLSKEGKVFSPERCYWRAKN